VQLCDSKKDCEDGSDEEVACCKYFGKDLFDWSSTEKPQLNQKIFEHTFYICILFQNSFC
jgi:hypothetical protein